MLCSIIQLAGSILMKHLVIGPRHKAPNFSAFLGHYMVEDSVIKLVSDLITKSDQAVRAVHSCNSWLLPIFKSKSF